MKKLYPVAIVWQLVAGTLASNPIEKHQFRAFSRTTDKFLPPQRIWQGQRFKITLAWMTEDEFDFFSVY